VPVHSAPQSVAGSGAQLARHKPACSPVPAHWSAWVSRSKTSLVPACAGAAGVGCGCGTGAERPRACPIVAGRPTIARLCVGNRPGGVAARPCRWYLELSENGFVCLLSGQRIRMLCPSGQRAGRMPGFVCGRNPSLPGWRVVVPGGAPRQPVPEKTHELRIETRPCLKAFVRSSPRFGERGYRFETKPDLYGSPTNTQRIAR